MKKHYNQPATLVSYIHPMTLMQAASPAFGGGGSGDPIGGGDPDSGI